MVPQASAFNNLVRQTSSALGVAAFTALLTGQQAQQLSNRAALLPANTPLLPQVPPQIPRWLEIYGFDQQAQLQSFAHAVDWLFIIVAILTAAGVILAMFLRSGPPPASDNGPNAAALAG